MLLIISIAYPLAWYKYCIKTNSKSEKEGTALQEFWEDLMETPEKDALVTRRGLRISFSRKELTKFFGILLGKRSLECMVGETAYWVLIPSLVAIYSFPILLFITKNPWYTLMSSLGLMMSMSLFNQFSYNFTINKYLVKPASNILAKLTINALGAILLYQAGMSLWLVGLPFIWWALNDFIPVIYLLSEMVLIKIKSWMWNLADPDGVLRQVGIYWAKKYGMKTNEHGKVL